MEKKTFKKIFIMMLLMIFTLSPLTSFAEPVINGGTIVVKKVEDPATPTNPEADPTKKDDKEGDKAKEKKSSDDKVKIHRSIKFLQQRLLFMKNYTILNLRKKKMVKVQLVDRLMVLMYPLLVV